MLSLERRRRCWTSLGVVRPKCRLTGTCGSVGRLRSAIGAGSGREPASWGCSEMVARVILLPKHADGPSIRGMSDNVFSRLSISPRAMRI